ncbi:MAG: hypothetical protein ACRDOK_03565 [Streptosporangiaceae bacterium]
MPIDDAARWIGRQQLAVGHSGAGPVLPQIAARIGAGPLIFVAADVSPDTGDAELMPAEILAGLRTLTVDGVLPRWPEWFGPGVMRELIPDPERRALITADLPRLPLGYFETRVPGPADWAAAGGGYMLLSDEAYGGQAAAAGARGWPVIRLPGDHLDMVTRPEAIAAAIAQLAAGLAVA